MKDVALRPWHRIPLWWAILACSGSALTAASAAPTAGSPVDFSTQVRPLLSSRCYPCHGPDDAARKAKLRLDLRDEALRDRNGRSALKPGDPARSEVLARVTSTDEDDVMPPPKAGHRLSAAEVDLLRRWIADGAPYTEHWAWKAPGRPPLPAARSKLWNRSPVDRFIDRRLQSEGLTPSAPADRRTLIRRLALDLTGLPPTPAEVRQFVNDREPDAYEHLVERYLASPAYGERWARVWLDLARYADSAGYGSDPLRPNVWPWRDWVIEAFNRNLPYDQFTIEQLAGDLLPEATEAQHVATAFHRNTMTNTEGGTDDEEYRVAAVKDRANTTAQVWMGLTLGCAQCHTHKYDPLSQKEYYQFFAFFNQTEDHDQPDERPTLPRPNPDEKARIAALRERVAALEAERAKTPAPFAAELAAWETRLRGGIPWQPLRLDRWQSTGASTLSSQPDGSVLASGRLPETDTVILRAPLAETNWTAFRLELLPDPSLPGGGFSRSESGLAVLTELQVAVRPARAEPPKARFVRLELHGVRRVLSLAEIQVFAGPTNLAAAGRATQSSTDAAAAAERAIDGRTEGDAAAGSLSSTRPEDEPWWELDLGAELPVEEIAVWNRTDRGLGTHLSDFKVLALTADRKTAWERTVGSPPAPVAFLRLPQESRLKLSNASADRAATNAPVAQAIDEDFDQKNGWSVGEADGRPHAASFEIEGAITNELGSALIFTLTQKHGTNHLLGRFRLSATTEPRPVRELPKAIADILATAPDRRTPAQQDELCAYFRAFAPCLASVNESLAQARRELDAIKPVGLPVLRELAADKRRETHLLHKGNFLDPGETVEPAVPTAFHPWPAGSPTNRLGLARWLVSRDNPLTARVAMNRLWAQLFGAGIVETEEDFGTQGALPTHPELLDWLAVEFMDRGWDFRAMVRLLVLSQTYRQSARLTPELWERDPRNRWLARAPRRRLEAEMVRDQALALSGLLSRKLGGPSVFPLQPEGLWRAAFNGERTWSTSEGEDRYRRGLYVFLRRTVPYPSLATFDAPSRESCTLRRLPTNTPLQAYVTLNDPVFVECAQALARRMLREGGADLEHCLRYGLELCLSRAATTRELRIVTSHFQSEWEHYRTRPDEARKFASEPLGPLWPGFSAAEAAAWTSVANVLLNLDAVLNRG